MNCSTMMNALLQMPVGWQSSALRCVFASVALLSTIWVAALASQKLSAAFRHRLFALGMIGVVVLPLFAGMTTGWHLPWPATTAPLPLSSIAPVGAGTSRVAHDALSDTVSAPEAALGFTEMIAASTTNAPSAKALTTPASTDSDATEIFAWSLLFVWMMGCGACLLARVRDWILTRQVMRSSVEVTAPTTRSLLTSLAESNRLGARRVRLRCSKAIQSPLTMGSVFPVIVLPTGYGKWSSGRLRAVLFHELVHIRRLDVMAQSVARLACVMYWFNPLVWLAARQMRAERELACDDELLMSGEPPADYAEHLVEIASAIRGRLWLPGAATAMASPATLKKRVAHIVQTDVNRKSISSPVSVLLASGSAVLVALVTLASPSIAEPPVNADVIAPSASEPSAPSPSPAEQSDHSLPTREPAGSIIESRAQQLGRQVHDRAMTIDTLPRLFIRAEHINYESAAKHTAKSERSLANLMLALRSKAGPTNQPAYECTFAWDPSRVLIRNQQPREAPSDLYSFWNREEGWKGGRQRNSGDFSRHASPVSLLSRASLFPFAFLQMSPHDYWFVQGVQRHELFHTKMPIDHGEFQKLPAESFAGEKCDVIHSVPRQERIWVSQATGRVRGHLHYIFQGDFPGLHQTKSLQAIATEAFDSPQEALAWVKALPQDQQHALWAQWAKEFEDDLYPIHLAVFSDYRKIAGEIELPFLEEHATWRHNLKDPNRFDYSLRTTRILETSTKTDLAEWEAELVPQPGDQILDRRYHLPVLYDYDPERNNSEILAMVDAAQEELAQRETEFARLTAPVEEMIGNAAPNLPSEGWIGDAPDIKGKPHLLAFWATWCGPCKNDVPSLNELAANFTVIGVHPGGTVEDQIRKRVETEAMAYPSVIGEPDTQGILGYPVKVFPYYILVGKNGNVAAHNFSLKEVLKSKSEVESLKR